MFILGKGCNDLCSCRLPEQLPQISSVPKLLSTTISSAKIKLYLRFLKILFTNYSWDNCVLDMISFLLPAFQMQNFWGCKTCIFVGSGTQKFTPLTVGMYSVIQMMVRCLTRHADEPKTASKISFSEPTQNLSLFPIIFFLTVFGFKLCTPCIVVV